MDPRLHPIASGPDREVIVTASSVPPALSVLSTLVHGVIAVEFQGDAFAPEVTAMDESISPPGALVGLSGPAAWPPVDINLILSTRVANLLNWILAGLIPAIEDPSVL